ncbi:MAG: protein of unknown function DUF4157 [Podoviridae sp. ctLUJ1]|nr:MAG: protein of unknown function DUF4157 [Podoviridae sp. ctLUJ1]
MKRVTVRKMGEGVIMPMVFWLYKTCTGISNLIGFTTFWHTVYLDEKHLHDEKLLAHELTHVKQIDDLGILKFSFQYLKELIQKGYRDNKFEVEARAAVLSNFRGIYVIERRTF